MRSYTNLLRPDTPFGSVTDPWRRPTKWLAAMSLLWGDAGADEPPVIMAAGLVVIPVHRARPRTVCAPLAQFGYRVVVPESIGENDQIIKVVDDALVQGRREAEVIAWHNAADDLYVLQQLPRREGAPRHAGIAAVAQACGDRAVHERSTARLVDCSHDLGPAAGHVSDTALAHGLVPMKEFTRAAQQEGAQLACEALVDERWGDCSPGILAASVLASAVSTALLGGKHAGRLVWREPLSITEFVGAVAWEVAPPLFSGVAPSVSE
ncbi:hypothetical protein [Streptomyces beigongshangae]|uniref:hypothetical protein n=1 Tax=Streptomyces beigongshangae TaxID=2841597 RepID=UPI001C847C1F|nr:hypothetical protein [Streptomyces sp. REN17]